MAAGPNGTLVLAHRDPLVDTVHALELDTALFQARGNGAGAGRSTDLLIVAERQ